MKKNILVVQSLLVLPLITSSITLGMSKEKQPSMTQEEIDKLQPAIKENHSPLFAELRKRFENNTITPKTSVSEPTKNETVVTMPTIYLSPLETTTVSKSPSTNITPVQATTTETTSTSIAQEKTTEVNLLEQSVMLPTEKKELTFLEKLSYYTSTSNQILANIIKQLEDKTFDTKDLNQFLRLEEAVVTATHKEDALSLIKIANLCEANYPKTIRISDEVATPASKVIETYYMKELNLANGDIQNKRQEKVQQWNNAKSLAVKTMQDAANTYNQSTNTIDEKYNTYLKEKSTNIEALRVDFKTFSLLNPSIRGDVTKVLINNKIKQPKVILDVTINQATKEFNLIAKELERIPSIQTFESKKTITAALEEKK